VDVVKSELIQVWANKELRENRRITLKEIAETTGLAPETIRKLRDGITTRFDSDVIAALCKFFDVPEGANVPFLTVHYDVSDS